MRTDDLLRAKGYRILARPHDAEPIWELPGIAVMPESEAVASVTKWERFHRPRATGTSLEGRCSDATAMAAVFVIAAFLIFAMAVVAHGKPIRNKSPKKAAPPVSLTYQTQYGAMTQTGSELSIDGPHWTARGRVRADGSLLLFWVEVSTGRLAPSVYRLQDGVPVGQWGFAPDSYVNEAGKMVGELRPDRISRVEPPPLD